MKPADHHDGLRQRMNEAAVLPPQDARRRALEEEIARAGIEAQQEWKLLLVENQALQAALTEVSLPTGFDQRLRDTLQREVASARRSRRWWKWAAGVLTTAACLIMAILLRPTVEDPQVASPAPPAEMEQALEQSHDSDTKSDTTRLVTYQDYQRVLVQSPERFEEIFYSSQWQDVSGNSGMAFRGGFLSRRDIELLQNEFGWQTPLFRENRP